MSLFINRLIKFLAVVLVCYCAMELVNLTAVDASQKDWTCVFGSGKYEKYDIMATGVEEAEVKFQRRFKEISPYVFPSVKCSITK